MDNFNNSFEFVMELEHPNKNKALHRNKRESGLTFMGIYENSHPTLEIWESIRNVLCFNDGDLEKSSVQAMNISGMRDRVKDFYKSSFWDRAKLDEIEGLAKCKQVLKFGVNIGMRTAIRDVQGIIKAYPDGLVGPETIQALNNFNQDDFVSIFIQKQIEYYDFLVKRNPRLDIFYKGWIYRANAQ